MPDKHYRNDSDALDSEYTVYFSKVEFIKMLRLRIAEN